MSDISGVIETCQLAVNKALENAKVKKVKKAIVGIAGELVKGTTTTVHYERGNSDARIDFPELKNIIQKVQMKAYERIQDQISWETGQNVDVKLINAAIVDVRIDGYQVTNPIGFQGKDVSISIFNAYAPIIHLGALQTIADELKVDLLSIAAEPYAVARSVDYEDVLDFSAIFIDIGGGTTDIAVVRNGGLEGTKMFAFGGKSFTKKLAQELRIDFDEAEALKIRYSEGKLGSDISLKVEQILQSDCAVWLSGVELSLAEFTSSDVLPSKILLCGGGSGLPGIKKALMSREWTSNLPFAKTISVGFMQPRDVARISDMTNELTNPQDVTPMGLANLVLDVTGEEKVMSGILRRVLHTIQD
ncbi:MAG: pilus assembly protein PilM [Candidatus Moranbacteria bacterium]|nr:pilus assembly protein PilM [Candidatus Moranbacteria bacterium]